MTYVTELTSVGARIFDVHASERTIARIRAFIFVNLWDCEVPGVSAQDSKRELAGLSNKSQ